MFVLFLSRFFLSFSFLIKIQFYYDLINNLQISGNTFNDNFSYSNYYYLYDKQLGESITINFGDRCMSEQLIFGGYINLNGYLYSTSQLDFWLYPNTDVIENTGKTSHDGYSQQQYTMFKIIKHEANCHISLQIPTTMEEIIRNGYEIPPIECDIHDYYIIYELKQNIWLWVYNKDDIVTMHIESLPYGTLYCEDTAIISTSKANCNFYYGHLPGPGQEITFEYYYSLASEPTAKYSQICSLQLVICGTNCDLSTCTIGVTCSACAATPISKTNALNVLTQRCHCIAITTLTHRPTVFIDVSIHVLHVKSQVIPQSITVKHA